MTVTPLRPDVMPALDVEREMLDFVAMKLRDYVTETGASPRSIALVLVGPDHGDALSIGYSWTPGDEESSRLQCCAVASAVLMKRAIGA